MRLAKRLFGACLLLAATAGFPSPAPAQLGEVGGRKNLAATDALFTNGTLHVLKIQIPAEGVRSLNRDARAYVKATLQEGSTVYSNILIRLKGGAGSFRRLEDKPGLTVKLEGTAGVFHGLTKFHLNNTVQDPSYLSEWICSEMFREAGVPAARAAHAVVELNGRRLGLYVLLESVNRDFLARYSRNTHGNVYGQGPNADITQPLEQMGGNENTNWEDLKVLAGVCAEPDVERLRVRLPQVLDLDRFISFMAMETMLGHWDGYTFNVKNYVVYHNLDTDKLIFIPHDLDQVMRNVDEPIVPRARGVVSRAIMRVPEFRERYRNRFGELFTNVFVTPVLIQRIDDRAAQLAAQLKNYAPELAGGFANRTLDLKSRFLNRFRSLIQKMKSPEPGLLSFVGNAAPLTGWRVANETDRTKLAQVTDASGKHSLWIAATSATTDSWRLKVVLAPGRYVFEGTARTALVKPSSNDDRGIGAGLRISGQARTNKLVGDVPWTPMRFEFQVTEAEPEIELICELRASQGEAWFDETTLRLVRR